VRDPDNTALVWSLNDVGLLYLAEGRLDEAEALFQRALLILSRQLPDEKAAAGTLLQHLADTAWRKNNLTAAASLYEQAASAFGESVGEAHPRYAAVLNGQAGVLHAMGEPAKAEELYRTALSIYEAQDPAQPVEVATPAHNLGLLYLDQGRLAEAGPMLKQAITALGDRPQQHAERALIMTRSMIRYCQQAGDMEMATLYQAKANDLMLSAMTP
jgi:tetratricopeptide (TPR) repeat protein